MILSLQEIVIGLVAAVLVAVVLLGSYHLTYRTSGRRLTLLYPVLAVFQVLQYLLTSPLAWPSATSASLGSAVLFPGVLMLILVIYIRKDIFEFHRVYQWVLWVNLALCAGACTARMFGLLGWGGGLAAEWSGVLGVRRIFFGTLLLLADAFILAWVFDRVRDRGQKVARLFVPLLAALVFDAVGFGLVVAWSRGEPGGAIVFSQLAAKSLAALVYAAILAGYLRAANGTAGMDPPRGLTCWQFLSSFLWLPPLGWVWWGRLRQWAYRSHVQPLTMPAGIRVAEGPNFEKLIRSARCELDQFAVLTICVPDVRGWEDRVVEPLRKWGREQKITGWLTLTPGGTARLLLCGWGRNFAAFVADQFEAKYSMDFTSDTAARRPVAVRVVEVFEQEDAPMSPLFAPRPAGHSELKPAGVAGIAAPMSPNTIAELRAAVEEAHGQPVRVTDPQTQQVYTITRQPDPAGANAATEPAPADVQPAQKAFWAALPAMLKDRKLRGKWVVFGPDGLIGAAARSVELYAVHAADPENRCIERVEPMDRPPWDPEPVFVPDRCASAADER